MKHFDASSIIYAWDNYPIELFPSVWDWLAGEFADGEIAISRVAYDEVGIRSPDCFAWLKGSRITKVAKTSNELSAAMSIKTVLGISNDDYHAKGVGENDLLIIATAKTSGAILITDEGRQNNLPNELRKYKIPAVCALPQVTVTTMNFIELIRGAGVKFG